MDGVATTERSVANRAFLIGPKDAKNMSGSVSGSIELGELSKYLVKTT